VLLSENSSEKKGDGLMVKAASRGKIGCVFHSNDRFEDAAELYCQAAAQYKIAKNWKKAGIAYTNAAGMSEKAKDSFGVAENFKNAAMAYLKVDSAEASKLFELTANMMIEQNRMSGAAKLFVKAGEICVEKQDLIGAIKMYQSAADCYEAEDMSASQNQMLILIAQFSGLVEDYEKAIQLFEKVAERSLDHALLKWGVKEHYFKAMLCWMAWSASNLDQLEHAEIAFLRYKENYPALEGTRECKLVSESLLALNEGDLDKLQDAIIEFDSIYKLDDWKATMMIRTKKIKPLALDLS